MGIGGGAPIGGPVPGDPGFGDIGGGGGIGGAFPGGEGGPTNIPGGIEDVGGGAFFVGGSPAQSILPRLDPIIGSIFTLGSLAGQLIGNQPGALASLEGAPVVNREVVAQSESAKRAIEENSQLGSNRGAAKSGFTGGRGSTILTLGSDLGTFGSGSRTLLGL